MLMFCSYQADRSDGGSGFKQTFRVSHLESFVLLSFAMKKTITVALYVHE